jgi:hypothetical protein
MKVASIFLAAIILSGCNAENTDKKTKIDQQQTTSNNSSPSITFPRVIKINFGKTLTFKDVIITDDSEHLTYEWRKVHAPIGGIIEFNNSKIKQPTATFSVPGQYLINIKVSDGINTTTETITILVDGELELIMKPIANSGEDISIFTGKSVELNATASTIKDNSVLFYEWTLFRNPSSSAIDFKSSISPIFTFTPDVDGKYIFKLTVTSGTGESSSDYIQITASTLTFSNKNIDKDDSSGYMWRTGRFVNRPWVLYDHWLDGNGDDTSGNTALNYCSSSEFGGYSDWRLPTTQEFHSINDEIREKFKYQHFWTVSQEETEYANSREIEFDNIGNLSENIQNSFFESDVTCLRDTFAGKNRRILSNETVILGTFPKVNAEYKWEISSAPKASILTFNSTEAMPTFTPDVDGDYNLSVSVMIDGIEYPKDKVSIEVFSSYTNIQIRREAGKTLMWQDDDMSASLLMNQSDAVEYCENLNLAEYNDWHLPTSEELFLLRRRLSPYKYIIDEFENVTNSYYWSSTNYSDNYFRAEKYIDLETTRNIGKYPQYHNSNLYNVRCVRSVE